MEAFIFVIGIGVLCIALGIVNMLGNISTIHSYHRKRVSEADRPAFGKLVGLGTVIIGGGVCVFGAISAITFNSESPIFTIIASTVLILSIIVGSIISFYAMKKYNGGIF